MATTSVRAGTYESAEMPNMESTRSGVSWGAIIGGAVAATVLTIVLITAGIGLGFSAVSPWSNAGASAAAVGVGAGIWFLIVQWFSSIIGGYIAGRLRTKWAAHGTDEVFFRDTAHGFLAWGLATLLTVWMIASAAGGLASLTGTAVSGAAQGATQIASSAAGAAASGAAGQLSSFNPMDSALDTLFRSATPNPNGDPAAVRAESGRILATGLTGTLKPEDRTYLAQVVAARTGVAQADAEARVDQVVAQAKSAADTARQVADTARKAAATAAILTAISLLIGAFLAAVGGAIGGRHRDLI